MGKSQSDNPSEDANLKKITLSTNEKAVFGSALTGCIELHQFYESSSNGQITSYYFENRAKILQNDNRVWNRDSAQSSEQWANPNKKISKGALVDLLQENIRRYYNDEPLIPVEFITERQKENGHVVKLSDGLKGQNLQASGTVIPAHEGKNTITGAELRIIWRLQNELNDPVISHILSETVSAVRVTSVKDNTADHGFCVTGVMPCQLPWDIDRKKWENRARKYEDAALSKVRGTPGDWVLRLLWLKNELEANPKARGDFPSMPDKIAAEVTLQLRDTLKQMKGLTSTTPEDNEIENKDSMTLSKTTPRPS